VETFLYATCTCGVVVADGAAHARWHAQLGAAIPTLAVDKTTLDPTTGDPVATEEP